METTPTAPKLTSFLIRFVFDEEDLPPGALPAAGEPAAGVPAGESAYRGVIRHIPSGEELAFTRWHSAVVFMRRFVPLEP